MGQVWDAIVNGMASIIKIFSVVGGNNTAIGIIIFTICIRLVILPLTLKAVRSGRAMQSLQPYIKEINERYKIKSGQRLSPERSQAKQAEVLALYKEYNVNPTASCLPVLIQVPVFFAVYGAVTKSLGTNDPLVQFVQNSWNLLAPSALTASNEANAILTNSKFLWIENLNKADPLYILPVLMVFFQFITQRMAMPKGGGADEQQRKLNSIMQWMPLIFGFTALNFSAGPVLYWVTTSIFSFIQQYFITGFQSLSDIPGLGWLPVKEVKLPQLEKRADDPSGNRKKTLMERLAESQEKILAEKSKSTDQVGKTSASKSSAENGKPSSGSFGRRADAGPIGGSKKTGSNGSEEENEARISEAYKQLTGRPPKKPSGNVKKKK